MKTHWLAVFVLFIVATAWGCTFTLIKGILANIAPEPFIFWRFIIAGIVLVIPAMVMRRLPRAALRPGSILGFLVLIGYWAQTRGLISITPSRSALLTGVYVVMVPFCDRIVYRTAIPLKAWIGSAIALVGTILLIGGVHARPQIGDLLTLFCAVCFALHVVFSAKWSMDVSALGLAAVQVMFVGIGAAPLMAFAARPRWTPFLVGVILFTAVVTTALAFAGLMWGQARVTATEAAVMLAFEPVAASVTSVAFYGEPVTTGFLVGAALILAAMVLSQLPEASKRDPIAP